MKRSGIILVAASLAAAIAVFFGQGFAQTPGRAAPAVARVAVCDVGAVFNGYNLRDKLNAELEKKRKAANDQDKQREDAIKALEGTLQQLKPESKEHLARLQQLDKLKIERNVWRKYAEQAFLNEHRQMMERLYKDILDAVGRTAKAKGYDLVLYREDVEIASQTTTELYKKIAQRKCLYYNSAIDLTQEVLAGLNR